MTRILFVVVLLITARAAHSEVRGILLEVTSFLEASSGVIEYSAPRVNIYSDEKKERRVDATVADAAQVLRVAPGLGSPVYVEILFHHQFIKPTDLITLLEAMKDNPVLTLARIENADSDASKREIERFKKNEAR